MKLALIIYASTQGVDLADADIEAARTALNDGDLAPPLVAAFAYFQRDAPGKLNGFFD